MSPQKRCRAHLSKTAKGGAASGVVMQRWASPRPWNDYYNRERPHGSLNYLPPISRSENGTTS